MPLDNVSKIFRARVGLDEKPEPAPAKKTAAKKTAAKKTAAKKATKEDS